MAFSGWTASGGGRTEGGPAGLPALASSHALSCHGGDVNRILAVGWLGGALLLAACGDDESPGGDDAAAACSVSASGSVSGTPACRATSVIHRADDDAFTFSLETEAGTPLSVLVLAKAQGRPDAASFTGPSEAFTCGVSVREGAKAWYSEYSSPRTDEFLTGSCTLTFSELDVDASTGSTTTYRYRGTLRAELKALERTGASGTVTLESSFHY